MIKLITWSLKDFGKGHSLMFKLSYINFQNVNDLHFSKNKFVENELTKWLHIQNICYFLSSLCLQALTTARFFWNKDAKERRFLKKNTRKNLTAFLPFGSC